MPDDILKLSRKAHGGRGHGGCDTQSELASPAESIGSAEAPAGRGATLGATSMTDPHLSQINPAQAGSDEATFDETPTQEPPRRSSKARKGEVSADQTARDTQQRTVSRDPSHRDGGDAGAARVGHQPCATQLPIADAGNIPGSSGADGGQSPNDTHSKDASIGNNPRKGGESGHTGPDTQRLRAALVETIAEIRVLWRHRQAWHTAEKALTLRAKALCRGLANEGDIKEADVIYNAALGLKGEHPLSQAAYAAIFPITDARDSIEKNRVVIEKRLVKLAKNLPTQEFITQTRGVRADTLAKIVGEAGDIGSYANPGKLWKRMGLAPHKGVSPATHKSIGSASADDWVAMGYSGLRRSVMWNVGAGFIKAGGPYRELYDARKALEMVKCEAIAADPEQARLYTRKGRKYSPKLHAHNRAQRYIEKRFLRELWCAWRAETGQASIETQRSSAVRRLITRKP